MAESERQTQQKPPVERRRHRRIPIAVKIFVGYLFTILLVLISNFYLFHRMGTLEKLGNEIGKSVEFVSAEREVQHLADDMNRHFLAYVSAYGQKFKDAYTEKFVDSAPEKILARIEEIRAQEKQLHFPNPELADQIDSYLDSLATAVKPPEKQRWERAFKNLSFLMEKSIIDAQTQTQKLLALSRQITAVAIRNGILLMVAMLVLSAGIAYLIAKRISRPIAHLRQATRYARQGKYNIRVPFESHDEIADLTADFNAMMDALGELDRMKAMFLSSITHDLKSPLYRVRLGIENLVDGIHGSLNPEQMRTLEQILTDLDTLSRLIYDILDLQKLESGRFELHLEDVKIEDFVRETVRKHAISFADKGVGLALKIKLKDVVVRMDVRQIERVFENLLSNALKFTPRGGKVVVIGGVDGDYVHFVVKDNGPGMTKEEAERVFDKFYRASTGKNISGTGLGLAITKQIVEAHRGQIWVETEPGKGCEFHFTIPLAR